MSDQIKKAIDVLREAFTNDPSYAHSWHCNIAMASYDAMGDDDGMESLPHNQRHKVANDAASRFMKLCFDVGTGA